jgi:hypothetical protein
MYTLKYMKDVCVNPISSTETSRPRFGGGYKKGTRGGLHASAMNARLLSGGVKWQSPRT